MWTAHARQNDPTRISLTARDINHRLAVLFAVFGGGFFGVSE